MLKLLTEEEKKKVEREYIVRRGIILLFSFILLLVLGITGLLPSYILTTARKNDVLERTRIVSGMESGEDGTALQAWLAEVNRELQALDPKLDTDRPSIFIGEVVDHKINGIRITGLSWIKAKGKVALTISGVASDRGTLIAFEDSIKSSKYFSDVVLPISNLTRDKDINFQIKLSLATPAVSDQTP